MNILGLDIGTTTVCAVVCDSDSGEMLRSVTVPNDTFIEGKASFERVQNPGAILDKCLTLADTLTSEFSVGAIGITGQMHGIVYLNRDGMAISPLYIWQDESGNQPFSGNESYAEHLSSLTGYKMATGYGCTTLYYHKENGAVPSDAVTICTIHDYVAMHLAGRKTPVMHTSDAASFGLFDLKALQFDTDALTKAGLPVELFPEVTKGFTVIGNYKESIPVTCAIGDNQASFLGSVSDMENSVLVNLGTGGQVSFLTQSADSTGLEVRPCFEDKYICVGPSLCGGRAFASLEKFLRGAVELVTGEPCKSAYPGMDRFLAENRIPENPLVVDTRFAGTREEPGLRGSVTNIGTENFTVEHLILGVMEGIVRELLDLYNSAEHGERTTLVCSGNGLRKNDALKAMFGSRFGMTPVTPAHNEEAAFGAALFAMTACGVKKDIYTAQSLIVLKA